MSLKRQLTYLLVATGCILLLPYIGAWIRFDGVFSDDYFEFPPLTAPAKRPFNMIIFLAIAFCFLVLTLLYFVPRIFGFKKYAPAAKVSREKIALPTWFWIGLVLWGGTLAVFIGKFSEPRWLINWAALPLFWGFTLMLDGLVYVRNNRRSLVNNAPREIIGIGVASISGWLIFEFLNFFVDDNWTYPKGSLIPDDEFTIYAVLGSSGLMPMAFEWYSLFNTFDKFKNKYSFGPKITLPGWLKIVLLVLAFAGLGIIAYFPDTLFGLLWVAPLIVLAIVLNEIGLWTPFNPIKNGDWSPVLLMALTYFVQGTLCECWNYLSATHAAGAGQAVITSNPDYWQYSIPFINVLHVFEMPFLGLMGYLPFGIYCGVWWLVFAFLLNIPTRFLNGELQ